MAVGRTLLVKGLFEANDDKRILGVLTFACTDGHTITTTTVDGTNPTVDLMKVESLAILPAGTEFSNDTVAAARPSGT